MKKLIFVLIPSFIFAGILFILVQSFLLRGNEQGALQVTASPKSKVYLNDKLIGETPLCKCEANDMVKTGEYTIRLVPQGSGLSEFREKITITKSVLTVVDRKFGKGATSEGSVITLQPLKDSNSRELLILSIPDRSEVLLDNTASGFSPLLLRDITESDHELTVKKSGYEDKKVRIRTPNGYKLIATIYLGIDEDGVSNTPTPSPSASPSATPTPVVEQSVTILQTPTGFLRVRKTSTVSGEEIGQVEPGDSYPLLDEANGWYKIRLTDGQEGWISSQYASKDGEEE